MAIHLDAQGNAGVSRTIARELQDLLAGSQTRRVVLEQLEYRGELASDDEDALDWTEWFLSPFFRCGAGAGQWRMGFMRATDLFHRLCSIKAGVPRRQVRCCVKDREDAVISERFSLPPFEAVHDLEFNAFCLASPEAREMLVIAAEGNHRAPSTLMQGFRELALLNHQSHGAVVLHAAALERDGEAVLILAPKGGGKTTLLARALLAGARLVTNDRAVVAGTQDGFAVVGVPTVIFLLSDTLDLVPAMRAHFQEPRQDFRRRIREIDQPGIRRISPGQFCELTQSAAVREAKIRKIIFLVDGNGKPLMVCPSRAAERLKQLVFDFTEVERYFFASLAPLDRASVEESAHQVCSTLCQEVTSWQVPREAKEASLPYLF